MWFLVMFGFSTPVERAMDACPYGRGADPYVIQQLLEIEEQAGLPSHASNILPSVWCVEASMRNPGRLRGDHGEAWGPMQIHGWLRRLCPGMDADNTLEAARCYMERIVVVEPKARKRCPDDSWEVAENITANWPRYKWRCKARSEHWSRRWKR